MNKFFNNTGKTALFVLSLIFFLSLIMPLISPYSEDIFGSTNFKISNQSPSKHHWFGTDSAGRDMFTITIRSATTSYKIAFFVVVLSMVLGCPLGFIAGLSNKWIDNLISRITDGFIAFPPLVLPIMITAMLGPSVNNMIIGISFSWFPWYVRIARSQTLILKTQGYIEMSNIMKGSKFHIIRKHIFPNSLRPILTQGSIDAGYAILISAGLSFIGLGAQPPQTEWGLLITQSRAQFLNHWWVITFPGLFIILSVFCFNIIGDNLRDINE